MKIHLFRLIPDEDSNDYSNIMYSDSNIGLDRKYPLYAFTDDKHLAAKFVAERNMEKFIYTVIKKDNDIAVEWMHHHRGSWLSMRKVGTFINKNSPNQELRYVNILITENEMSYLDELLEISPVSVIANCCKFINPIVFTDEVYDALSTLGYQDIVEMCLISSDMYESEPMTVWELESSRGISFDPLGIFVLMYDNILTELFYENIEFVDEE